MASVIHDAAGMSRTQRRRIECLADQVDKVTQGDAAFFRRHPERNHRIRLLSQPEREMLAIATSGADPVMRPGHEWIAAVRQVRLGARLRQFGTVLAGTDLDQPEHLCRNTFEQLVGNSQRARDIEAAMASVMEGGAHG